MRHKLSLSLGLCLLVTCVAAAQDAGTITMVDGSLHVMRGVSVLQAGEGVRLRPGDIIENSATGFVQVELAGSVVVALGPSSRLYVLSAGRGGRAEGIAAELVLLSGWLKAETTGNSRYRYMMPLLGAATRDGTIVLHAGGDTGDLYVESGSAGIAEIGPDGSWRDIGNARVGQFFSRRAGKNASSQARPTPAFIDAMPRQFKDTLPHRAARFAKAVEPKRDHEVSYSEAQPWLTMPRAWRRGLVRRFEPRLNDASFRKSVDAHMHEHPEWDPILHPEKYEPKPTPAAEKPKPPSGSQ